MLEIAEKLADWREHPSQMVRELFDTNPDPWQEETLEAFPKSPRLAMKACKGPGKTAVLAWIGWNFLLTRPRPKCAATSISADNLRDNFWTEMAKWRNRSPFLTSRFEHTAKRIFAVDHPDEWFMSARSWPKTADATQQADTLAGLHADYILFVLDESGGIPDAVMASAEAALSSCVEGHIVQAGNPTHLTGPLWRACSLEKRLWYVVEITGDPDDPRRSTRISIQWARDQIEKYGRDNPWVLVNVFGKFPPSSLNVLIGPDEVRAAMQRMYKEYDLVNSPRILGQDVARYGDDQSVTAKRRGLQMYPLIKRRNLNSVQGAGMLAREWNDFDADACFVDDTGGFGAGWIDQLHLLGKAPIGVGFATQAHNSGRYFNKRAEMAFDFVDWIKMGGALPDDPAIVAQATQTTYTFKGDKFLLEPKESVKEKLGGVSPDEFDACILTFAEPVQPRNRRHRAVPMTSDYDPYASQSLDQMVGRSYGGRGIASDYDPYGGGP